MGAKLSKRKRVSKDPVSTFAFDHTERTDDSTTSEVEEKCYDPNDPTIPFFDGEDEMDFECNDYQSLRALMSCGHSVTPMSLTNWCRWQLDQGEYVFECGQTDCDGEWSFEEVCKMALLTPKEIDYFETKVSSNYKGIFDVKSCPSCRSSVVRTELNNLSVQCNTCKASKRRPFIFCWQCLREWKGSSRNSDRCDNDGCVNESLETLKNCPTISFKHVDDVIGCPAVRACPTCGFLVGHDRTGCKDIFCCRCRVKFCFVCLKTTDDCYKTSEAFEPCSSGLAPRQTSIPQWQPA